MEKTNNRELERINTHFTFIGPGVKRSYYDGDVYFTTKDKANRAIFFNNMFAEFVLNIKEGDFIAFCINEDRQLFVGRVNSLLPTENKGTKIQVVDRKDSRTYKTFNKEILKGFEGSWEHDGVRVQEASGMLLHRLKKM